MEKANGSVPFVGGNLRLSSTQPSSSTLSSVIDRFIEDPRIQNQVRNSSPIPLARLSSTMQINSQNVNSRLVPAVTPSALPTSLGSRFSILSKGGTRLSPSPAPAIAESSTPEPSNPAPLVQATSLSENATAESSRLKYASPSPAPAETQPSVNSADAAKRFLASLEAKEPKPNAVSRPTSVQSATPRKSLASMLTSARPANAPPSVKRSFASMMAESRNKSPVIAEKRSEATSTPPRRTERERPTSSRDSTSRRESSSRLNTPELVRIKAEILDYSPVESASSPSPRNDLVAKPSRRMSDRSDMSIAESIPEPKGADPEAKVESAVTNANAAIPKAQLPIVKKEQHEEEIPKSPSPRKPFILGKALNELGSTTKNKAASPVPSKQISAKEEPREEEISESPPPKKILKSRHSMTKEPNAKGNSASSNTPPKLEKNLRRNTRSRPSTSDSRESRSRQSTKDEDARFRDEIIAIKKELSRPSTSESRASRPRTRARNEEAKFHDEILAIKSELMGGNSSVEIPDNENAPIIISSSSEGEDYGDDQF